MAERAGVVRPKSYKNKPIEYIDPAPRPFEVQISLVEYFERIKRLRTDKWQKHFCEYLQNAVVNRHIKPTWAEFHAQAQAGKTVILSQAFKAWCFGHDPLWRATLAMFNVSRSEAHSEVVIQTLQSDLHKDIFPNKDGHLPSTVSRSGWMTNARREVNDGQNSFNPVGLQSGMVGTGFDDLTIDDPYKEPKEAWSETVYANMARFWQFGVNARLSNHACIFAMFHRYNYDDFGGYLLNTGKFDYVRYASIADGSYSHDDTGQVFDDPLGRSDGELLSPERFDHDYYRNKRDDPKVWLSMFQGRPGRDEGDFFQVGRIDVAYDSDWSQVALRARGWDHAATQGGGDHSAGGWVGFQPDETVIVADVFSGQLDSAARVAKQKEIAAADGASTTVVVPEGISSDGKDVVFMMQQNLQDFNVVARKVTNAAPGSDAKKRRAYNFSVAVNAGRVKFLEGEWVDRVKRLMRRFGNALSGDDEIDALSDAYNYLYEEFHKGLILKTFPILQTWQDFAFGNHIPKHWTVYAGIKLSEDKTFPTSGVVVARAAENSGLQDTLFIVAEYKAYDGNFENLFNWLDATLKNNCEKPETAIIHLHPDAEHFLPTIRQKLKYGTRVFKEDAVAGLVETNWYLQKQGLIGLVDGSQKESAINHDGLKDLRQEAATWGHDQKGEPTKVGQIWDCIRMICYQFRTISKPKTIEEKIDDLIPETTKLAMKEAVTSGEKLSAALTYDFEKEIATQMLIPEQDRFGAEYE